MKSQRLRRSREAAREEILGAAESALHEVDFSALTVDGVMKRTGMRRSSFYHYFSSLDDLAVALLEQFEDELRGSVEPWFRGEFDDEVREALGRHLTAMFEVMHAHRIRVEAVAQAARASPRVYEEWRTRVLDHFIDRTATTIRRQVMQGHSHVENPDRLAEALVLMNYAVWNANLQRVPPDGPESLARVASSVWNASIFGR